MRLHLLILGLVVSNVYGSVVVTTMTIPSLSVGQVTHLTSSSPAIDETYQLVITAPNIPNGTKGYIAYEGLRVNVPGSGGTVGESFYGVADFRLNDQATYSGSTGQVGGINCLHGDSGCTANFVYGMAFTLRIQADAKVNYDYSGLNEQKFAGTTVRSSIDLGGIQIYANYLGNPNYFSARYDVVADGVGVQHWLGTDINFTDPVTISDVPEPRGMGLVGLGLGVVGIWGRKKKHPTRL